MQKNGVFAKIGVFVKIGVLANIDVFLEKYLEIGVIA
jgi:hypothetical protein